MITIETIAKKAGVSRGTVDRVLHNRGRVKEKTAERVWAVMEELNFQPNALGRAFYLSREKNKIGVLIAFREPDFERQVVQGVKDGVAYAQQHGIEVLTEIAAPDDHAAYLSARERLLSGGVRGLALRGIESERLDGRLRELAAERFPVVTYNEDVENGLRDCFVGQDSYKSGACAAFLMRQITPPEGRVLVIGVDPRHCSSAERIQGFAGNFREGGLLSPVLYGHGSHQLVYRLTREKLAEHPQPAGIYVSGAGLSGAAHAVDDAGLTGRIKVVGFDTTESNVAFMKKGTVQFLIDQDPYLQGYKSIQLLADAIFQDQPVALAHYETGIQIKTPCNC